MSLCHLFTYDICFCSDLGLDYCPSVMPFPFGKSQKSPAEIVRSLKENVACLEKLDAGDTKKCEKVRHFFLRCLCKCIFYISQLHLINSSLLLTVV